jgi:ribosomal protein L24
MAVSRSKFKVRSGDTVVVIAGKQKGHTGRVVKVLPEKEQVVVEGLSSSGTRSPSETVRVGSWRRRCP